MKTIIKVNRARCKNCGWVIESVGDFHLVICECGKISIDGGLKALRRYSDLGSIEELSETYVEQETNT